MNGYIAIYKGKRIEVRSNTIYHAQLQAAAQFGVKPNKSWQINVMLAERPDGSEVVHTAVD